jgi:hypothetical protein
MRRKLLYLPAEQQQAKTAKVRRLAAESSSALLENTRQVFIHRKLKPIEGRHQYIRTGRGFDAVIDFNAALPDPSHLARLLPVHDSGDYPHPNDAGYSPIATAIDLSLFASVEMHPAF